MKEPPSVTSTKGGSSCLKSVQKVKGSIVHRLLLDSIDTLEEAVDGHRVSIETGASGNELLIKQSLTDANTKYKQYIDELNKLIDKNDIEIDIN